MIPKNHNGKIRFAACEVSVALHCNLSCSACSHLAPRASRYFVNPEQLHRDLSLLAPHCRPARVGLLGGEPLLHPDLPEVIEAVKASGISGSIRIVTNGVLLDKMPGPIWQQIDEIHISLHPEHEVSGRDLRLFQRRARDYGVDLVLRYADEFRQPFAEAGTGDNHLIQRIYDTCQIAHTWQCHAVFEGYFYRCFQSALIPRILLAQSGADLVADGLLLSSRDSLGNELTAFLAESKPPKSCRHCLGTVGLPIRVKQERRQHVQVPRTTEELVDWKHLDYLENGHAIGMRPVYQLASRLLKRGLPYMPASFQVHPAVMWAIAKMRKKHHIWQ